MTGFTLADDDDVLTLFDEGLTELRRRNFNKIGLRKDARTILGFPTTLNKIEEVDETRSRSPENDNGKNEDENGNPRCGQPGYTASRPRSSCAAFRATSKIPVKRADWETASCASGSSCLSVPQRRRRPKSAGAMPAKPSIRELYSVRAWDDAASDDIDSLLGFEGATRDSGRPSSACGLRRGSCSTESYNAEDPTDSRRYRSNPNIARESTSGRDNGRWDKNEHVLKFKRSLKLMGLEPRDFGIVDCPQSPQSPPRPSRRRAEPTFSTKVMRRSLSLDCLREVANQASMTDSLDLTKRRLLSHAAYEEWYFRKKSEAARKRERDRELATKNKEKLEIEYVERQQKAQEEFHKWVETKSERAKSDGKKEHTEIKKSYSRVRKTKEQAEKAYLEWKKGKEKQFGKKNQNKIEEEERKKEEEKQKEEKKAQAEKAFQEWKRKVEEVRKQSQKKQEEKEQERKPDVGRDRKTSFQAWKDIKDTEIKHRMQQARQVARVTSAVRSVKVAERIYEAEQAFEEWLDKVDQRQLHRKNVRNLKRQPWSPP